MKNFTKLFLIIALFTATSFAADGHTSGGGRTCPSGQTTCLVAETDVDTTDNSGKDGEVSIFEYLADFFVEIFE